MVSVPGDVVCTVTFMGGGPADGKTMRLTKLDGIKERRYLEGFFWGAVYAIPRESADVYCSIEPHESEEVFPPKTLELWFNPAADVTEWVY